MLPLTSSAIVAVFNHSFYHGATLYITGRYYHQDFHRCIFFPINIRNHHSTFNRRRDFTCHAPNKTSWNLLVFRLRCISPFLPRMFCLDKQHHFLQHHTGLWYHSGMSGAVQSAVLKSCKFLHYSVSVIPCEIPAKSQNPSKLDKRNQIHSTFCYKDWFPHSCLWQTYPLLRTNTWAPCPSAPTVQCPALPLWLSPTLFLPLISSDQVQDLASAS